MSCKMASRIYLLCLLVSLLTVSYIECRGGSRGSSRGSSRGGGSRGGWGSWGSSSHSWSKPSSSSSSRWGGSSSHSYPSSSSGLSGSSGSHSYPSSSSGLSGFGSTSYNKPSSSSGSSWSSGSHSYPSSSSGLSGSGYNSYNKPSSSSGSSWSSGTHSYPSSSSGLSGSGSSSYNKPSSGSGSHTYPSGSGLSGSHSNSNNNHFNRPGYTYNTNSGHYTPNVHYSVPSYYTAPQYVYIHEYRNSNSRYGDLLTGLSLYNLGRSQSHYHDHYYYDDYYRRRYDNPSSTSYRQENKPQDSANCVLKVKENGRVEVLKIPCEIVSTFALGNKKVAPPQQTPVNKTVCTSTITTVNNTVSSVPAATVTPGPTMLTNVSLDSSALNSTNTSSSNKTELVAGYDLNALLSVVNQQNSSLNDIYKTLESLNTLNSAPVTQSPGSNFTTNSSMSPVNSTVLNATTTLLVNSSSGGVSRTVTTVNATTVNVTVCTTNSSFVDPLTVQGPPVDPKNMQCVVEIQTKEAFFSNVIDCSTLVQYAKLPEPKKNTGILPPREKLKSWLANPPWWMSLFIAV